MSRAATAEPPTATPATAKAVPLRREILTRDPEVSARKALDERAVEHYAELMRDGAEFPALVVFDDGEKLYIADGFLRDAASSRAGFEVVLCEVRRGTRREAQLYAIQANARHGLKLSRADKRRALERLLRDQEWARWSNRMLARLTGYSSMSVRRYRDVLRPETVGSPRLGMRAGKVLTVRTDTRTRMPKEPPPAAAAPEPEPEKPGTPPNYLANWLYYLQHMTPEQLARWRNIIKTRVDLSLLAEAVDLVMRESAAQAVK